MSATTTTIIHTVYGDRTLCGKYAPIKNTCSGKQINALNTPWISCPVCTLAATCTQLDTARTAPTRTADNRERIAHGARGRWTQPQLFN